MLTLTLMSHPNANPSSNANPNNSVTRNVPSMSHPDLAMSHRRLWAPSVPIGPHLCILVDPLQRYKIIGIYDVSKSNRWLCYGYSTNIWWIFNGYLMVGWRLFQSYFEPHLFGIDDKGINGILKAYRCLFTANREVDNEARLSWPSFGVNLTRHLIYLSVGLGLRLGLGVRINRPGGRVICV